MRVGRGLGRGEWDYNAMPIPPKVAWKILSQREAGRLIEERVALGLGLLLWFCRVVLVFFCFGALFLFRAPEAKMLRLAS